MVEPFDPYRKWLGIPPKDQPAHFYRLLGIATFEDDPDVIENAAARQMSHVRTFQTSKQHGAISQRILTELSAAKLCLLTPERKEEYDQQLRTRLAAAGQLSSTDLSGAVAAEAADEEAAAEPELPPLRQGGETRWRTGAAVEAATQPPPVPIPLPTAAVPAVGSAGDFPSIRRSAMPSSASRTYRKRSILPVIMMLVSLVTLIALGAVALVYVNQQGHAAHKSKTRPAPSAPSATAVPVSNDKHATRNNSSSASSSTPFPVGTAIGATANEPPSASPAATSTRPTEHSEPGELTDQLRQALFLTEQALKDRNDAEFGEHFQRAEELASNKELSQQAKFQEQVDDLRVLKKLCDEFWEAVRDYGLKMPVGERIEFQVHKFELISRDGETVEYVLNGQTHKHDIGQLEPTAAVLIASKAIKWEEPVTFLPIAAFLSVDGRITDDSQRQFGKQLFAIGRLIGQANPAIARKLGVKESDEIKLDEDLAKKLPLPEKKPEPE
jgi:hypothetical protein